MPADDFGDLVAAKATRIGDADKKGTKRVWLKAFETLPNQMLNSYGLSKWINTSDKAVWQAMSLPLKIGAAYLAELRLRTLRAVVLQLIVG